MGGGEEEIGGWGGGWVGGRSYLGGQGVVFVVDELDAVGWVGRWVGGVGGCFVSGWRRGAHLTYLITATSAARARSAC